MAVSAGRAAAGVRVRVAGGFAAAVLPARRFGAACFAIAVVAVTRFRPLACRADPAAGFRAAGPRATGFGAARFSATGRRAPVAFLPGCFAAGRFAASFFAVAARALVLTEAVFRVAIRDAGAFRVASFCAADLALPAAGRAVFFTVAAAFGRGTLASPRVALPANRAFAFDDGRRTGLLRWVEAMALHSRHG
jgi:hypothetical protein